jgi:uroporphyrinogen decarboxylase
MLTAKQNAMEIIRFGKPEKIVQGIPAYTLKYYGVDHESWEGVKEDSPAGAKWIDTWGVGWEKAYDGVMGLPKLNPLSEPSALKSYQWPDPDDERICSRIYEMAKEYDPGSGCFLAGSHRDTLFEKAYMLVGMENLFEYFFTEPNFVLEVFHRITDFNIGIQRHYLKAGVEIAFLGDDLGCQLGPLVNPQYVAEFMVPEYKRLMSVYTGNSVLMEFHSCGAIERFLDIFIGLKLDVLNPVQATANNLDTIRKLTMGKLAIHGAVSSGLVYDGPLEKIKSAVHSTILKLGQNGGYFCSPDQGMPYPQSHLDAFNEAVEEYGRYPLEGDKTDPG